jgi:hypothetical protein
MTDQQHHPITPPPELVQQWGREFVYGPPTEPAESHAYIAACAAQWGADQELEACCAWLPKLPPWSADDLRRHRRPKPPSLKEQALKALAHILNNSATQLGADTIRRALEALPDD